MLFKYEKAMWYDMFLKVWKSYKYAFQTWQVIWYTCSVFHVNSSCDAVWKESMHDGIWKYKDMIEHERRLWFYIKDLILLSYSNENKLQWIYSGLDEKPPRIVLIFEDENLLRRVECNNPNFYDSRFPLNEENLSLDHVWNGISV